MSDREIDLPGSSAQEPKHQPSSGIAPDNPGLDYSRLFHQALGPYFVVDPQFTIIAATDAYLRATMTTREQIVGKNIFDAFPDNPDELNSTGVANLRRSLLQVLETGLADLMHIQKYDVRRPASEGGQFEERYWSVVNTPIFDESGKIVQILHSAEDVTALLHGHLTGPDQGTFKTLRSTLSALHDSEARFRALVTASSDFVYRMSPDWARLFIVHDRGFLTEYESPDQPWLNTFIPEIDRALVTQTIRHCIETRSPFELEHRVFRKDGSIGWTVSRAVPLLDAKGQILEWFGAAADVTERKNAEESLRLQKEQFRALTNRIEKIREEERIKIARDLHDQIGQILTGIKMQIAGIEKRIPEPAPEIQRRFTEVRELINEGIKSVRTICSGLRPVLLDELGLGAAIEWYAKEFSQRTGIQCAVALPDSALQLEPDATTAVFRIFQEALNNVLRHAEASAIQISLADTGQTSVLIVKDNGKGFHPAALLISLGILGMKERAQVCGGEVHVSSAPGKGTSVTVRIPNQSME